MANDIMHYYKDSPVRLRKAINASRLSLIVLRLHFGLMKKSALYNVFVAFVVKNKPLRSVARKLGFYNDTQYTLNTYSESAIEETARKLREISHLYDTTVLIIPNRTLWVEETADEEARTHDSFVYLLRERGFRVVDVGPALEKSGAPLEHYFRKDGHWNEDGHRLAAEALLSVYRK